MFREKVNRAKNPRSRSRSCTGTDALGGVRRSPEFAREASGVGGEEAGVAAVGVDDEAAREGNPGAMVAAHDGAAAGAVVRGRKAGRLDVEVLEDLPREAEALHNRRRQAHVGGAYY